MRIVVRGILAGALSLGIVGAVHGADDVKALVAKVRAVKPMGAGHREATEAVRALSKADVQHITDVLAGMDGADLLVANWLRGTAEAMAQRQLDAGGKLPIEALENFLQNISHSPRGRRVAYELIARVDNKAEQRLIPRMINDPSLELRRDAVALAIKTAEAKETDGERKVYLKRTLTAARDLDQVNLIAEKLKALGDKPDLAFHFGYLMKWKLVAPFDNVGGKGFNVAYPPELGVDTKAEYEGKSGAIRWVDHVTTDDMGTVDLNKALDKHKGAVAYAVAEFLSDEDRDVDVRIASDCATKVWLNGQPVSSNEIYHANMVFDQYVGRGKLRKGSNQILVKIAQNEQTEAWAQDWKFQLRICDSIGSAVRSQDRQVPNAASRVDATIKLR